MVLASSVLFLSTISASASTTSSFPGAAAADTLLGIGTAGAATLGISELFPSSAKSVAIPAVPQAPEISPEGIGSGLTLLSGAFLIVTGRRRKR